MKKISERETELKPFIPTGDRRLALQGALAGKTVLLCGVQFRGGLGSVPSSKDYDGVVTYLSRCYQVKEVRGEDATDPQGEPGPVQGVDGGAGRDAGAAGPADALAGAGDPPPGAAERDPEGNGPGGAEAVEVLVERKRVTRGGKAGK